MFALALALQLAILAAVPAKKVRAHFSGREITLETRPIDPYDLLSGYYVTLGYAIERPPDELLPPLETGEVWLVVEPGDPAWRLVEVRLARPLELARDRVAIRATWMYGMAQIEGAQRLYIPESQRHEIDALMRQQNGRALVDLKVSAGGEPAVLRMRLGGRSFGD
jgi:uncharacterized membrane-anchored protein